MKKHFRIALLAVMAILMVGMLALGAFAAAPDPAETDFYQVLDANGEHVAYYATLAEAKAGVTAQGYTIKVLKDATESTVVVFDQAFAFILDGNGKTITYSLKTEGLDKKDLFTFSGTGAVTIKNLTVKLLAASAKDSAGADLGEFTSVSAAKAAVQALVAAAEPGTDAANPDKYTVTEYPVHTGSLIAVRAVCDLTLENVVLDGGNNQVLADAAARMFVKGENTQLGLACMGWTFTLQNASKGGMLTIEGGLVTEGEKGVIDLAGADLTVSGGKLTSNKTTIIDMTNGTNIGFVTITGGELESRAGTIIKYSGVGDNASTRVAGVLITGGTFRISGSGDVIFLKGDNSLKGRMVVQIEGGSFEELTLDTFKGSYVKIEGNDKARVEITGGRFGSFDNANNPLGGSTVNSILRAYNGATGTFIVRGGIFGNALAWIRTDCGVKFYIYPCTVEGRTGEPKFICNRTEGDIRAIWFHNASRNGEMRIAGGTFEITTPKPRLVNAAGARLVITGGTFKHNGEGICLADGDQVSEVYIAGGSFEATGYKPTIQYSCRPGGKPAQAGLVEISGGDFKASIGANIIQYTTTKASPVFTIKGGTFFSESSAIINMKNVNAELVISGNPTFRTMGNDVIYLDKNPGVLRIEGGTFILEELPEDADRKYVADNAVILVASRDSATLTINGGTFIDLRTGNNQVFLVKNAKAVVNLNGGVMLSKTVKSFFYRDYDNTHRNMYFDASTPYQVTIDEVTYYYCAMRAGNANAPIRNTVASARVNDGSEGIRFTSMVTKAQASALAKLADDNTKVTYGTLIMSAKTMKDLVSATLEADLKVNALGVNFHAALKKVAADASKAENKVFLDVVADKGLTTDADGNITYRASLIHLKSNTATYAAVSYAKVTVDGEDQYFYGNVLTAQDGCSMAIAAQLALNDTNDQVGVVGSYTYKYRSILNEKVYSRFSKEVQEKLKSYIPAA